MSVSVSQMNCVQRYNAKTYDILTVYFPKGTKERIRAIVGKDKDGKPNSLNKFIREAVAEKLDKVTQ